MTLRIGRTLPPAVAPISLKSIGSGILAMFRGDVATRNFTDQLKKHFNVKHCFLLSSGKASLTLILQALKELNPEKDEVLIPAFTCYSVPAAIVRAGLKIRLCDIEVETLDFDYRELAEHLASPRLLCVIPTHLFGLTADIPRVREIVGSRNIAIIEDAAQTMGGEQKGHKAGTLGDVGFFSLDRGKALSTVEGGIILTNSDKIGSALCRQLDTIPEYSVIQNNSFWHSTQPPCLYFPGPGSSGFPKCCRFSGWERPFSIRTFR
jgi:perosamine synthetase